jgi:hypothetical protein
MKNKRFIGLTALIAALFGMALLVTGCPTEAEGPTETEKAATALATTRGGTASGTTVTLGDGTTTLAAAVTVPAGVTLVVPAGKTLATSTFAITVNGIVTVNGTGTLTSTLTGTGEVVVDGSTASVTATTPPTSIGKLTAKNGASVTIAGSNIVGASGNYVVPASATFELSPLPSSKTAYAVKAGTVTLKASREETIMSGDSLTVDASATMVVPSTATLTVADGGIFKVDGTVNVPTNGTLNLGSSTTGISTASYLKGTINVSGILADKKTEGAAFWNGGLYYATPSTGKFVLNAGASASPQTSLFTIGAGASLTLRAGANAIANADVYQYEIASGTVTLNTTYALGASEKLVVRTGSTLALGSYALSGAIDASSSAVSLISFEGTAVSTGSGSALNFYPSNSTSGSVAVAGKTYNWSASAGGGQVVGWKATN